MGREKKTVVQIYNSIFEHVLIWDMFGEHIVKHIVAVLHLKLPGSQEEKGVKGSSSRGISQLPRSLGRRRKGYGMS